MNKFALILVVFVAFFSCQDDTPLPILGEVETVEGKEIHHAIADFAFLNQDSTTITNEDFSDVIYVADFFFTKCPSICPIVKKQMIRIHDEFKNDKLKLVSYTMDPERDTPSVLKDYADRLEVSSPKWHFLTGDKKELHDISPEYFSIIIEDGDVPGGFDHTGKLLLVDQNRHIRAFCEGTDEEDVTDFIKDIKKLLSENEK